MKEMVRDVGHLPLGSDIFTEDHLRLSSLGNFGYFGSVASTINAGMGMQSQFEKLGQQEDDSYAGYGNKRFTKQEYRQYKDSLAQGINRITNADTPNSAVENMRRLEGPYAGSISSYTYSGTIPKDGDDKLILNYQNVMAAIDADTGKLVTQIQALTGKTHEQLMAMYRTAPGFYNIYQKLAGNALSLLLHGPGTEDADADTMRQARMELDQYVDLLNKLLFDYFKNDKRIHPPVMHLISLLNHGIQLVDRGYNNAKREAKDDGELGEIRQDLTSTGWMINAGGAQALMSPSHYESYIQIYKTPQEAVRQYARYQELRDRDNEEG